MNKDTAKGMIKLLELLKLQEEAMYRIPRSMKELGKSLPDPTTMGREEADLVLMHRELDNALSTTVEVAEDYVTCATRVRDFVRAQLPDLPAPDVWTPKA
jgi:hypothetical protein